MFKVGDKVRYYGDKKVGSNLSLKTGVDYTITGIPKDYEGCVYLDCKFTEYPYNEKYFYKEKNYTFLKQSLKGEGIYNNLKVKSEVDGDELKLLFSTGAINSISQLEELIDNLKEIRDAAGSN